MSTRPSSTGTVLAARSRSRWRSGTMTAGSPKRRWPCRTREGQRSLARRPRAEAVLEARRVLRGERILLRPLASSDLRRGVEWFSDPQIIRFLGPVAPGTLPDEE